MGDEDQGGEHHGGDGGGREGGDDGIEARPNAVAGLILFAADANLAPRTSSPTKPRSAEWLFCCAVRRRWQSAAVGTSKHRALRLPPFPPVSPFARWTAFATRGCASLCCHR